MGKHTDPKIDEKEDDRAEKKGAVAKTKRVEINEISTSVKATEGEVPEEKDDLPIGGEAKEWNRIQPGEKREAAQEKRATKEDVDKQKTLAKAILRKNGERSQ